MYLPNDRMALALHKDRAWPTDTTLIKFGRGVCRVRDPEHTMNRIAQAVNDYQPAQAESVWSMQRRLLQAPYVKC